MFSEEISTMQQLSKNILGRAWGNTDDIRKINWDMWWRDTEKVVEWSTSLKSMFQTGV